MVEKKIKIAHLTSAHPWEDIRIFQKECRSLAQDPKFEVHLLACKGEDNSIDGVQIHKVHYVHKGRFDRMTKGVNAMLEAALVLDADVYHLHDPELLRIALKLKRRGKKVIYDAHEDLPRQILGKYWIPKLLRRAFASGFERYENFIAKRLDAVVTATPFIRERFKKINQLVLDVNNYPIVKENSHFSKLEGGNYISYAGGISSQRGIKTLVQALEYLPQLKLKLAGKYSPENFREELVHLPSWNQVEEMGFLNRQDVKSLLQGSVAGLVTLKPLPNYLDSLPIKMFEYMLEGIPVVASDFPYWKGIVEKNECGLCVNPENPKAIAAAIQFLLDHPEKAKKMGENGKKIVLEHLNWENEAKKLLEMYHLIVAR